MTKIAIIFLAWVFLLLASGGGLTRADYQSVPVVDNSMNCYNYEMVSDQMFELQSKRIYSKGLKRKVIERKINKLFPSYMNRQTLCLGYTLEAN